MSEIKLAIMNIVILLRAHEFSHLLHQGVELTLKDVLRYTKPMSSGRISIFLYTFPHTGHFKQTAECLAN